MIQSTETAFARERALLLLRQVAHVARGVLDSAPRTLIRPRLFVLDVRDPTAAELLEQYPPSTWLAGLVSGEGVNVFALEFRDAYEALSHFDPSVLQAADNFEAAAVPCLVVTEGAFAFLPLGPDRIAAPAPVRTVN